MAAMDLASSAGVGARSVALHFTNAMGEGWLLWLGDSSVRLTHLACDKAP